MRSTSINSFCLKTPATLIVNACALVIAVLLLGTNHGEAQAVPYLALGLAPLGTNAVSLTITNGVSGGTYEILWTPDLFDTLDYPWTRIATGNAAQTNFAVDKGPYQSGFFAADIIPSWEVNSGMVAWWRAQQIGLPNGAAMTNWTDRYGNALHGSATFDAFGMNGYSAVDFNINANNALSNSVILPNHPSLTNCGTLFVMFAWAHPSVIPGGEAILDCSISNNASWFILTPIPTSPSGMNFLEDGWFSNGSFCAGNIAFDSYPYDDEHLFLMTWTNGEWQDYVDGKVIDNYPNGGHVSNPIFPVSLVGMLTIGNIVNDVWPLQGSISEIGIATNYWDFSTVDQAANYILKASDMIRPTIVLHGDSMTFGGNGSYLGGLTDYLSTNFPGWTIDNCAVPGNGSAIILSNFLYMANYSTAGTNKAIDIFWDNLNLDVLGNATNNLYADATAAAAHGKIPVLVVPPSCPVTDTNGERFIFENTMTNNPGPFQFLCNLSLNPNVGYPNAWTNGIYYNPVGGIHLTNAGNATISVQFISTIEQIMNH